MGVLRRSNVFNLFLLLQVILRRPLRVKHLLLKLIPKNLENLVVDLNLVLRLVGLLAERGLVFEYLVEYLIGKTYLVVFHHHYAFLQALEDLLELVVELVIKLFLLEYIVDVQCFV